MVVRFHVDEELDEWKMMLSGLDSLLVRCLFSFDLPMCQLKILTVEHSNADCVTSSSRLC